MGKCNRMVKIDGKKLQKELAKRCLRQNDVSLEIGYEQAYLAHCIARGTLRENTILMLEKIYGIPRDEYVVKEEPPVIEKEQTSEAVPAFDDEFWKTLRMVISSAVYEAVHRAWNEPYDKK